MPRRNPKVAVAGAAAVTLVLGLAAGALLGSRLGGSAGAVSLHVNGAMALTVFCGTTTVHSDGTDVDFLARDEPCEVEAALSPVMPVRGQLYVTSPGAYRCTRDGTVLICSGPE